MYIHIFIENALAIGTSVAATKNFSSETNQNAKCKYVLMVRGRSTCLTWWANTHHSNWGEIISKK